MSKNYRSDEALRETVRNIIKAYEASLSTGMWMTILGREISIARKIIGDEPCK